MPIVAEDYTDIFHTGPGTLAGRYLRRFWQPVYRARDLAPGRAVPVRIMGEDFTLYRGEGGASHLLAFRCAHRGTQLSTGWVEEDCLRCLYHGWKYDGSGQCVEQPGEDEGFAAKVRLRSYPTQEYLGLVFGYFGEGEPPPLPRFLDFEEPGVVDVYPPEYWPCNYFNRIDNAADAAHLTFAHRASRQAIDNVRTLPAVTAEETDYGVVTSMHPPGKPRLSLHFNMPNVNTFFQAELKLRDPLNPDATGSVGRLLFRVPVDDESCVSFPLDHVPLTGDRGKEYLERRRAVEEAQRQPGKDPVEFAERVLGTELTVEQIKELDPANLKTLTSVEDYVAQVAQGHPSVRGQDRFGRMDVGVVLIRKIWERELLRLSKGLPLKEWAVNKRIKAGAAV
jgi:5,5'-dehydrodivanillate O-demethylase oxygenase subunit